MNSNEIQKKLGAFLIASGAANQWYDEDEGIDVEDDLVRAFLGEDIRLPDGGSLELIYQAGGGEGSGEHVEAVFKLEGVFYMATWNYYSHYGYSWDDLEFTEVAPKEKTVTVYEPV